MQKLRLGTLHGAVDVFCAGIGIPEGDLPHVFDPFFRAGNVAGRFDGAGQVIEQHGGAIDVQSQESLGSDFTIRLPLEPTTLDLDLPAVHPILQNQASAH